MRLKIATCLLALTFGGGTTGFKSFRPVESYESKPGVLIVPYYSAAHEVCRISIEKRHFSGTFIDLDGTMPKQEFISLFDKLVTNEERGRPIGADPPGVEILHTDDDHVWKLIEYENVIFELHGRRLMNVVERSKKDTPEEPQGYFAAIIKWRNRTCEAK